MRILPLLGSTLGLVAVLGGGLAVGPDLLPGSSAPAAPATQKAANATTGSAADRATSIGGMNPVTGANSTATGYVLDRSVLGLPVLPNAPSVQLPELKLSPPAPGQAGSVRTGTRSQQFGHTATWAAQPQVDGPERRLVRTAPENGYVVIPAEAGDLHLLCGETSEGRTGTGSYYVDSHDGEWRVYRVDGGPNYDVRYRFVQYDRSPLSARTTCE